MSFMTWVAATLSCVLLLVADVRFHSSCEERAAYVQTSLDLVGAACAKDACSADCAAAHATAWRKATFMVSEWRGALGEGRRRCVRTGKLGIQKKCHVVWPPPERAWPDAHAGSFPAIVTPPLLQNAITMGSFGEDGLMCTKPSSGLLGLFGKTEAPCAAVAGDALAAHTEQCGAAPNLYFTFWVVLDYVACSPTFRPDDDPHNEL